MSNTTLIDIIQGSGLEEADKDTWMTRVEDEGVSPALINELRANIRAHQEHLTQQVATLVSGIPELNEAAGDMNAEIDAATADFEADMHGLQREADAIASDASRAIEKLTAEEKLDNISEE